MQLCGIPGDVVELDVAALPGFVSRDEDQLVALASDSSPLPREAGHVVPWILGMNELVIRFDPALPLRRIRAAFDVARQGASVESRRKRLTEKGEGGRHHIDEPCHARDGPPRRNAARIAKDQRHTERSFVEILPMGECVAVLAEALAVIGGEDDERGIEPARALETVEQPSQLGVDRCDLSVVEGDRVFDLARRHRVLKDDPPLLAPSGGEPRIGPGPAPGRVVESVERWRGVVGPVRIEIVHPEIEPLARSEPHDPVERLVRDFAGAVAVPAVLRVRVDLEVFLESGAGAKKDVAREGRRAGAAPPHPLGEGRDVLGQLRPESAHLVGGRPEAREQ